MANSKKLSVIIVTYQEIDIVRNCLDSIQKYNDIGDELEVIISDNSEDDVLYEAIKAEYDWVKIIKNKNEGFGAGNNRGFEISTGKYLLFLNPDTILTEPVFQFAIDQFEKDVDLALFGVQLRSVDGKKNVSYFLMDKYGILAALSIKLSRLFNHYRDGKMFVSGADLFVRRESFDQAGRFDQKIFMYNEEPDLIRRIKLRSNVKKTSFFRQKNIIHLEGATESSSGRIFNQQKYERAWESDDYYCNKWNMNLLKKYKSMRRLKRVKLWILKLLKRKTYEAENQILKFYDDKIRAIEVAR